MVTVTKFRGVVIKKPSGDQSVRRGQHANQSILGSVPASSNGQAAQVGSVQFVGLEIGDDGVNLFGNLFQFGQTSPVLDVGLDPLIDLSLGGFRWCVEFQYWSLGPDNIGMKRISRSSRSRGRLFGVRG